MKMPGNTTEDPRCERCQSSAYMPNAARARVCMKCKYIDERQLWCTSHTNYAPESEFPDVQRDYHNYLTGTSDKVVRGKICNNCRSKKRKRNAEKSEKRRQAKRYRRPLESDEGDTASVNASDVEEEPELEEKNDLAGPSNSRLFSEPNLSSTLPADNDIPLTTRIPPSLLEYQGSQTYNHEPPTSFTPTDMDDERPESEPSDQSDASMANFSSTLDLGESSPWMLSPWMRFQHREEAMFPPALDLGETTSVSSGSVEDGNSSGYDFDEDIDPFGGTLFASSDGSLGQEFLERLGAFP